ncbi:MAG: quinate 5-dehydrogenase [Anaerolineales bacterium]|nr:MAG: quinate 5-dehydrogenase [Anaerolineales bacterium]
MKRAVSISLGSTSRDKAVEINLLGETVRIERIGTNGDEAKARQMFREMDGKVDAFGVGGIDLGVHTPWKFYPLYGALKLVQDVKQTPYVDGGGLKETLEARVMQWVEQKIGDQIHPKTAFLVAGITRYGMTESFIKAGYQCVFGDLMFGLDIPIAIGSMSALKTTAKLLMPIVGRMPLSMLYPTGEKQEKVTPKYEKYYQGNTVTGGDFLYVKQHMPEDMRGKIIVTNTTTPADVEFLKQRGVKYLVTTTLSFDGRTFGTNMMEAALVAVAGKGRVLTAEELNALIDQLGFEPQLRELN